MATKYFHPGQEAAQKDLDKLDLLMDWVDKNITVGSRVRFKGSRSNKRSDIPFREVLAINKQEHYYTRSYPNPDFVEFDKKGTKWGTPEYKTLWEEYQMRPSSETVYHIRLASRKPQISITSKTVDPRISKPELRPTVVADNNAESLSEVFIDGDWVKMSKIMKDLMK